MVTLRWWEWSQNFQGVFRTEDYRIVRDARGFTVWYRSPLWARLGPQFVEGTLAALQRFTGWPRLDEVKGTIKR